MDDVERLFTQLVQVLTESQPERLTSAFQLSELYQSMIPYRKYKKQLGFESNEDYEMAVLRLFAGVSDYAMVEPEEVREQLVIEAEATNPNPGAFREFAAARVKLNSSAVRSVQTASRSLRLLLLAKLPVPSLNSGRSLPLLSTRSSKRYPNHPSSMRSNTQVQER